MRTTIHPRSEQGTNRLRRRIRAAAAGVALVGLALTGVVAVAPADAATTAAPNVKLVSGDRMITAAWSAVPGAVSYTVRLSKKKSLSHARVVQTTNRSVKLTKVANGTPYYVSVTANRAVTTPATAISPATTIATTVRSSVVKAAAAKGVPFPVSKVSVASGPGVNQVTVSWTGGGRANKVAVIAGSSVLANERPFHSDWYPSTTRSITITVPEQYRAYMGAGTGNPVWVKVVESNGVSNAFGASYAYDRQYRPSTPGTWAFAGNAVPAEPVTRLTVAELNTQSVGSTAHFSATNQWANRAPRLADYINTTSPKPDLLLTAELSTEKVRSCANHPYLGQPYACRSATQVADLARRLDGLQLADTDAYDRVLDRMNDAPAWAGQVTDGAHVFYNPDALTRLEWGYFSPAMSAGPHANGVTGLGVTPWSTKSVGADRWLSWAKFETKDGSGRQFYAVAAHFPVGDAQVVVDTRAKVAAKVTAAIDAMNTGHLPVVFGGDLNSDAVRNAQAPQVTFIRDGWFDAASVSSKSQRTGMKVSTANGSGPQAGKDPGYGPKPIRHPYETSRIDYILLKNSPYTYSYANVLRLHPDGTFIKSLQGTDHNMQLATIGIGDPVP